MVDPRSTRHEPALGDFVLDLLEHSHCLVFYILLGGLE